MGFQCAEYSPPNKCKVLTFGPNASRAINAKNHYGTTLVLFVWDHFAVNMRSIFFRLREGVHEESRHLASSGVVVKSSDISNPTEVFHA